MFVRLFFMKNITVPKGKLLAIGGAEDKGEKKKSEIKRSYLNFFEKGILRRIVDEAGGKGARIEVITTASTIPFEVGNNYLNSYGKIGCTNIGIIHIQKREDTLEQEYFDRLTKADAIMFSGGNQLRLTAVFGGTDLLQLIKERYYNEPIIVAGTSAGAMAMGSTMIYEGSAPLAHLKGVVKSTTGLGFMNDVIFDSHFEMRGRFSRLAQVVAANPFCIGIGLGEDTGMMITNGNQMEAIGSGLVVIVDGHNIHHSNIADIPEGYPISIENLKVHFCAKGNGFLVKERKFVELMGEETHPHMQDVH